jgi:hypothetical protein
MGGLTRWPDLAIRAARVVTFHDGSPITSSTIADIVERDRAEPGPTGVAPGFRDVIALDTPTPRELVVRLARPSSLLLEALALTRIVGGDSGAHGAGPFRQPAGEGPERLEAFDGYFRGRPAIDRVELRSYPTARTAWVALMRGEVDFLHEVAPDAVEFVEAGSDVHACLVPAAVSVPARVQRPPPGDCKTGACGSRSTRPSIGPGSSPARSRGGGCPLAVMCGPATGRSTTGRPHSSSTPRAPRGGSTRRGSRCRPARRRPSSESIPPDLSSCPPTTRSSND